MRATGAAGGGKPTMQEITSANTSMPGLAGRIERTPAERPPTRSAPHTEREPGAETGDQVELSAAAQEFDPQGLVDLAFAQRMEQIRADIAADTYLTPEKLDVVVERLFEELTRPGQ